MSLRWGERTYVMGVLNLTPDSFSDGGRFLKPERALRQARRLVAEGAAILDLGAQSTRPGAVEVGPEEELNRLLPVLAALRAAISSGALAPAPLLSIDTFDAAVAEAALTAGADWLNDVRGASSLRDPAMLPLVAAQGCPYVVMHSRGTSASMDGMTDYRDVVLEVRDGLLAASDQAMAAGVKPAQLIWDPGLGFAKSTEQNLALLRGLATLRAEGFPLLIGPSRKRFIGAVLDQPKPTARLWGTAAVCAQAIGAGVDVLRVHDVGPLVQTARMVDAIVRSPLDQPAA